MEDVPNLWSEKTVSAQPDLFESDLQRLFDDWADTPGGRQVLRIAYARTAQFGSRFKRNGRRVSIKLIWELMRDDIAFIKARTRAKGLTFHKVNGFALNNNFHAYLARHIVQHRTDWEGLFEMRETK